MGAGISQTAKKAQQDRDEIPAPPQPANKSMHVVDLQDRIPSVGQR